MSRLDVYGAAHVDGARLAVGDLELPVSVGWVGIRDELVEQAVLVVDGVVEVNPECLYTDGATC